MFKNHAMEAPILRYVGKHNTTLNSEVKLL